MKEEALKLADELANEKSEKWITRQEASAMIRRLVEELENERRKAKAFRQSNQVADTQIKALVEELDKQGEPVASWLKMGLPQAPQTKPLSDEDIDAIGDEVSSLIDTYAGRRDFARAIEAKVRGEK